MRCTRARPQVAWASVSDCLVQSVTAWSGMGGVPQPVVNAVCAILSVAAGISGAGELRASVD